MPRPRQSSRAWGHGPGPELSRDMESCRRWSHNAQVELGHEAPSTATGFTPAPGPGAASAILEGEVGVLVPDACRTSADTDRLRGMRWCVLVGAHQKGKVEAYAMPETVVVSSTGELHGLPGVSCGSWGCQARWSFCADGGVKASESLLLLPVTCRRGETMRPPRCRPAQLGVSRPVPPRALPPGAWERC